MAIITATERQHVRLLRLPPVSQRDLLHRRVRPQRHQRVSQKDLLHRQSLQHQTNLLRQHPDQIIHLRPHPDQVQWDHPVAGVVAVEGDN